MKLPLIPIFENKIYKNVIKNFHVPEEKCVKSLFESCTPSDDMQKKIQRRAIEIINLQRNVTSINSVKKIMQQYDLSNDEGIALMCLAEALLRIPDSATRDALIENQILKGDWKGHLKQSDSMFVNTATWGLMLTGKILTGKKIKKQEQEEFYEGVLKKALKNTSKPVIRKVVQKMMQIMGEQFVMAEDIVSAIKRAHKTKVDGYCYSYDMLGEGARTQKMADFYFDEYMGAIEAIGKGNEKSKRLDDGISIKLSALDSRYMLNQYELVHDRLYKKLKTLVQKAKEYDLQVTIDAEEVDRLDLSLSLIERLLLDEDLKDYNKLGLALQAYQKRAFYVIDFLVDLAKKAKKSIPVRLVKGAYWDTEIKIAQENGHDGYPVFTRKVHTDISYIACANKLLDNIDVIYPQFATHNAHSIALVRELTLQKNIKTDQFEYQCLHGLGDSIYESWLTKDEQKDIRCRVYSPVGVYRDLLAYLVRRLLENGANSSFINKMNNKSLSPKELVSDPMLEFEQTKGHMHPNIPLPVNLFKDRLNSRGDDLFYATDLKQIDEDCKNIKTKYKTNALNLEVADTSLDKVDQIVKNAKKAYLKFSKTSVHSRAEKLNKLADLINEHRTYFYELMIKEAGKSVPNAISEVREAMDFCRYYAQEAIKLLDKPQGLPGPTGEDNSFRYESRGVMVSISPWNFPLAIFLGGVSASLACGNCVVAKPAEQTPKIAQFAIDLCYQAGFDKHEVQGVYGLGETHGDALIKHEDIDGVIFTGSTITAQIINKTLAARDGAILPLIAETGGLNVMVVDSSALLEQVTDDVIGSAFDSAGQRCSALRVLMVQEDIYDSLKEMVVGAMSELVVGDTDNYQVDIGPVIDKEAYEHLTKYVKSNKAKIAYQTKLSDKYCDKTSDIYKRLVQPTLLELKSFDDVKCEIFGPVLHLVSYKEKDFKKTIDAINAKGYGLTVGMHSRIDTRINYLCDNIHCGNVYINRNIIGAVVGVQPFGGQGMSGTGPKAGGPNYLRRLLHEKVVSNDITAAGGNAKLMLLED